VRGRAQHKEPLRIEAIYDRTIGRMKVILFGGAKDIGSAIKLITSMLEE
jgi:diacylglycerol kinase